MRQIKFRAKHKKSGEWVYGDLLTNHPFHGIAILESGCINYAVDPETVCQFTGVCDKNGKQIFEGDILKDTEDNIGVVVWIEEWSMFGTLTDYEYPEYAQKKVLALDESMFWSFPIEESKSVVEGNKFDNPELLHS